MEWKTIIIHESEVMSKNDGDMHFINAHQLINLYQINRKKFKVVISKNWNLKGIHVSPLYKGNYKEEAERLGIL